MSKVGKLISGFFGGGSTVLYVLLGMLVLGMYANYKLVLKENARLVTANETLTATVSGQANAMNTMGAQQQRGKDNAKDKADSEDVLDDVKDSNVCTNSDPIRVTLDWLSTRRGGKAAASGDEPNVRVPPPPSYP